MDQQKIDRVMKYLGGMQDSCGSDGDMALYSHYYRGWCEMYKAMNADETLVGVTSLELHDQAIAKAKAEQVTYSNIDTRMQFNADGSLGEWTEQDRVAPARRVRRVKSKLSGRTGIVTKATNGCLWVTMDDDGSEFSGHKQHWLTIVSR